MEEKREYRFYLFLVAVVAIEAILFSAGNFELEKAAAELEGKRNLIREKIEALDIAAKAISIYDLTLNEKLYGREDGAVMPIASLAKIMTAIVAINEYNPEEIITLSEDAIGEKGDYGLFVNEIWKVKDLAKFTLITSSNDGASALSFGNDEKFLEKMNRKAVKIGMRNASFFNATGLDIAPGIPGAQASALGVNGMIFYALKLNPEIFSTTALPEINLTSLSVIPHTFKNTNEAVDKIPNLIFSKTGFTELAGGNLAVVFKDKKGSEIAVTILGSTFTARFFDMEKIVNILYNI